MNKISTALFIVIFLFSASACRTKKIAQKEEQQKISMSEEEQLKSRIIPNISTSDFNFKFLTAKAKVKVNRGGKDFALSFNIRMQHDEQIWISVNAIAGIEVARVLLNKDSVRLLDRFNKQYIVRDYQFLSDLLNTPVDFYLLQDLLIGNNPKSFDYVNSKLNVFDNNYEFIGMKDFIGFIIDLRKEDTKMIRLNLTDTRTTKKAVIVNYGDFKLIDNSNFPHLITSTASSEKESLSLNLEYVKVEKVEKLEFPFNVPKKFD